MSTEKRIPVITISREYGAGGRTIAKGLSEKLGIPWYDRDFVKLTAQVSGYSEDDIFTEGEQISEGEIFLKTLLNNIADYTSSHDAIYRAQKEAIIELAKEPCIIVGRCANLILQDEGIPSFDIFLHADLDIRVQRAIDNARDNVPDMKKYVMKKDEQRDRYYKTYTKREINEAQEYTICLDTGAVEYATCIDTLATMISHWHSRYSK